MGEIDRVLPTFAPPSAQRGPYAVTGREGRRPPRDPRRDAPEDQLELHAEEPDEDGAASRPSAETPPRKPAPPTPRLDLSA